MAVINNKDTERSWRQMTAAFPVWLKSKMAALDTQFAYFWNLMHKNSNSQLTIAIYSSIIYTTIVDYTLNYILFKMMILKIFKNLKYVFILSLLPTHPTPLVALI